MLGSYRSESYTPCTINCRVGQASALSHQTCCGGCPIPAFGCVSALSQILGNIGRQRGTGSERTGWQVEALIKPDEDARLAPRVIVGAGTRPIAIHRAVCLQRDAQVALQQLACSFSAVTVRIKDSTEEQLGTTFSPTVSTKNFRLISKDTIE